MKEENKAFWAKQLTEGKWMVANQFSEVHQLCAEARAFGDSIQLDRPIYFAQVSWALLDGGVDLGGTPRGDFSQH